MYRRMTTTATTYLSKHHQQDVLLDVGWRSTKKDERGGGTQQSVLFGCLLDWLVGWFDLALPLSYWVPKTPVKCPSFVGVGLSEIVLTTIQPIIIAVLVSVLRYSCIQSVSQPTAHRGLWKTKERREGRNTAVGCCSTKMRGKRATKPGFWVPFVWCRTSPVAPLSNSHHRAACFPSQPSTTM
ncbi:unnamed protein product [Onchocerca ochengi]|uniref:G_PROTEIN_RECEP_F1_2 domain-containing protein n=1 Tax=Onchocerca ochengi TaxID=42157 RepID=A0A182E1S7_ONCOC|nr:unnamed protein product [Onchocerca ochengi]